MNSDIVGLLTRNALVLVGAAVILAIVVYILKNRQCADSPDGKLYYEHFESPNDWSVSAIRTRIAKIQDLKEELLVYGEEVGVLADETCAIMKTVEEKYVQNASQFRNMEDYERPQAERDRMIAERQRLAKKRFLDQKSMYSAVNGQKPLLECFYAQGGDVLNAESELNNQIMELEKILNTTEVKAAALKKEKVAMSLGFSLNYLQDAVRSLEGGAEAKEGFYAELTGAALIARADALIGKAAAMKKELAELNALLEKENGMIRTLEAAKRKEEKGGNPAERDAQLARMAARN